MYESICKNKTGMVSLILTVNLFNPDCTNGDPDCNCGESNCNNSGPDCNYGDPDCNSGDSENSTTSCNIWSLQTRSRG